MSSAQVFDIYQKVENDESIQRVETRTYYPFVKSFNNNDIIEITINQADAWLLMYDAVICIQGTSKKTAGNGTVSLVNNAGAFLFDTISYELNGKEIDGVRDPGILSTLRGYLCYTMDDSRHMVVAGWNYPTVAIRNSDDDGTFYMRIPLSHILNVFNDYKFAMYGKHTIRLVRARNDNNCLHINEPEGVEAGTTKVTFKVDNIELKVKHIVPNDIIRLGLLQSIKDDKPIYIPYRKWVLHQLPSLKQGATKEIWSIKTSAATQCPRYVVIAFQTAKIDILSEDPTLFNHINISDLRLYINNDYYPQESMKLNFEKSDFIEAFNNYAEFYPSYANVHKKETLLDYLAFKNRSIFVIDCSKRYDPMKSSTVDIKVEIEARDGFPASTRAYCLIIHDCIIEYHPLSEIIRQIL